jgi:hypothetical protein
MEDCKKKKKKLDKKIEKIDEVLGDRKLLFKEFAKYNSLQPDSKKLKNANVYKKMLVRERNKCKAEYDNGCRAAFGDGYVPPKGSGGADDKPDYSAMVAGLKASGDL